MTLVVGAGSGTLLPPPPHWVLCRVYRETRWAARLTGCTSEVETVAMACGEDCDQILLASGKANDDGWRENGEE